LTKTSALGDDHATNSSNNMSVLGVEHAIVPPEAGATGSATSFLSGASTNSDQGLSLDSDQNGLLTKTSALGDDHATNSSNNMSVLGVEHAIVPPVTDAASSATSFLSGASANSDQGLSLESDQNGLLTKTFALANDNAIDLSGTAGVQSHVSTTDMHAFGGDHATAPANQNGTDHAAGPANAAAFGGDQLATLDMNNGGAAAPVTNDLAPAPGAHALGSGLLAGPTSDAAFGGDQADVSPASEVDASALASGLHGGSTQTLLSSLLNV
jgi:hypothetical protein